MLNNLGARGMVARFVDPLAQRLIDKGVSPDTVTYVGAAGTSLAALWFFPRGQFLWGVLVIMLFVFSDLLDGTMARLSGRAGAWGNYLDSTLDRIADGAVFGGVLIYFAMEQESLATAAAWVCLVGGFTVSYAKARAESLGAEANVGIAERAERLIVILLAAFLQGLGLTWALPAAVVLLAVLTLVTIAQRFTRVHQQLAPHAPAAPPAAESPAAAEPSAPLAWPMTPPAPPTAHRPAPEPAQVPAPAPQPPAQPPAPQYSAQQAAPQYPAQPPASAQPPAPQYPAQPPAPQHPVPPAPPTAELPVWPPAPQTAELPAQPPAPEPEPPRPATFFDQDAPPPSR